MNTLDPCTASTLARTTRRLLRERDPRIGGAVTASVALLGGLTDEGAAAVAVFVPLWLALVGHHGLGPFPGADFLAVTERLPLCDREALDLASAGQRLGLLAVVDDSTLALCAPGTLYRDLLPPSSTPDP